ncbi:MAG: pantetheine-phosphate adenylyltransferase [Thermaerobacter sp.]|jgi:pantetheine-phosphate adenylyltransferase|nr:pantetheine-phosphate adenylyltransferase [Thermaerobacter sp.]
MPEVIALYPGTFDPVTNGHLDVIERVAPLFGRLVVTVFRNSGKRPLFSAVERVDMLREVTAHLENVEVDSFEGLTVDYARRRGARVLVRGLRAVLEFDYEFQMALMNKTLAENLETVFILTSSQYSYLSSTIIKELASYGAPLTGLVPPSVEERLRQKFDAGRR